MTAATLAWFEDDDPRWFARWSFAAAAVVGIHAVLIAGYLLWQPPTTEIGDDTSGVAIDLIAPDIDRQEQAPVERPTPRQVTTAEVALPVEKPPEKVEPVDPSPRTTARADAQAPQHIDPSWQTLLQKHLQRFKNYPSAARARNEEGVVLLTFSIDRSGHVLARHIATGSGHADLDAEVLAMVERAQPMPSFPASMTQAQLEFTVPIRFSLH